MNTTTEKTKTTPRARFFATGASALENGSFRKVTYRPAWARGVSTYINGDYMGSMPLATPAACDAMAGLMRAGDEREYTPAEFKALAPKCCGGKGRL